MAYFTIALFFVARTFTKAGTYFLISKIIYVIRFFYRTICHFLTELLLLHKITVRITDIKKGLLNIWKGSIFVDNVLILTWQCLTAAYAHSRVCFKLITTLTPSFLFVHFSLVIKLQSFFPQLSPSNWSLHSHTPHLHNPLSKIRRNKTKQIYTMQPKLLEFPKANLTSLSNLQSLI